MHQRSIGSATLSTKSVGGDVRIADLYQQGCAKIRFPNTSNKKSMEAVMINTAGGITGGDRLCWAFDAASGSNLTVTSQACERLYRSNEGTARIEVELKAHNNAHLNWLPQETILFNGCHTEREITAHIGDNSRLLLVESLLFGRAEMAETVQSGSFHDHWHIKHNGKMIHADHLRFDGSIAAHLEKMPITNGAIAVASALVVDTREQSKLESQLDSVRDLVGGGASFWKIGETGKLFARLTASDGYELRKTLVPLIELLNQEASVPKSWAL